MISSTMGCQGGSCPPCRQASLDACAWVIGLCHDLPNVAISPLWRGLCLLFVDSDCHIARMPMI